MSEGSQRGQAVEKARLHGSLTAAAKAGVEENRLSQR
jgi:hypothetical protein